MNGSEFAIRRQKNIRRATLTGFLGIVAAILAMLLVVAIVAVALAAKPEPSSPYIRGASATETDTTAATTSER